MYVHGNAVVIQNKDDYLNKVHSLLTSGGKFNQLNGDETVKRETRLHNYLLKLNKDDEIDDETYKRVYPCGSRAGVMYGLPKIHKEGVPVRPIISACGTYNFRLAKYLDQILKPLIPTNNYIIKDTFDFVNKVSKLPNTPNQRMVSFDVESLFTNIPTQETINIILDRAYKDNATEYYGLKRETLEKLLIICTQQSHFQFNGKYYDQIDGVAMGSPLGPLFANIFMDEFEQSKMKKLTELGVKIWLRYVDDVFAIIEHESQSDAILDYLNKQHINIKFTIES